MVSNLVGQYGAKNILQQPHSGPDPTFLGLCWPLRHIAACRPLPHLVGNLSAVTRAPTAPLKSISPPTRCHLPLPPPPPPTAASRQSTIGRFRSAAKSLPQALSPSPQLHGPRGDLILPRIHRGSIVDLALDSPSSGRPGHRSAARWRHSTSRRDFMQRR
jgi:hypothetical protein